ncbi:unnamed protein product [Caenorhabditis auriculariae]|uniref:Uncharacterized protein n=1 Tax=Caenorhabditis auriculariae TaxID=2777116 RepID=A0A8S1HJZ4_9PELO|nr:unnamed protein product [Caenorhabditis auriculariae]
MCRPKVGGKRVLSATLPAFFLSPLFRRLLRTDVTHRFADVVAESPRPFFRSAASLDCTKSSSDVDHIFHLPSPLFLLNMMRFFVLLALISTAFACLPGLGGGCGGGCGAALPPPPPVACGGGCGAAPFPAGPVAAPYAPAPYSAPLPAGNAYVGK